MARVRNALIIDGYVDEPACFGVPPYVSPYVRYCAGVMFSHGIDVRSATCDQWRLARAEYGYAIASSDVVLVIMGLTVPGRYRGGSPLTLRELREISGIKRAGVLAVGGPVRMGYTLRGGSSAERIDVEGVDFTAFGDPEMSLDIFCGTGEWVSDARRSYGWLDGRRKIAALGAGIVKLHPSYPDIIAEIELSRGCDKAACGAPCSFCTEGLSRLYEERSAEGVISEIEALDAHGVSAYRLGRAASILAWGGRMTGNGVRPDPKRLESLYSGIRRGAKNLAVLHTDNCNPMTIAAFPDESSACFEVIARHNSGGDGLSLGIESLDPDVRKLNRLKTSFGDSLTAVRLINQAGGMRKGRGLPALLPGLNFLFGLAGETVEGMEWNTRFLEAILEEGLSVRRINIRRAMVFPGTELASLAMTHPPRIGERDFRRWKRWVRGAVDPEMLSRVAPDGTILRKVILENREGNVIFGRQLGSYPPLVGVVSPLLERGMKIDAAVTGRGGRSLTAVRYPLDANLAARAELTALPEIGRARADFIASHVPYGSAEEFKKILSELDSPGIADRLSIYFGGGREGSG
ncbi:MAG: radical SAM protein [Synergistaceae bacterium]|jgi:radical SAM superfamily enzyme with C-terminal helix-hairpin-helix motif|nr:radical SAM protein [Synergistaceae bacterium]